MGIPKVKFKIASLETEAQRVFDFREFLIKKFDLKTNSVWKVPFTEEIKKQIINANSFNDVKKDLTVHLKNFVTKTKVNLLELKKEWDKFNNYFFESLRKITEQDFKFDEYECNIIFSHVGHYREGTNQVFVNSENSIRVMVGVCAEEILHLHYWSIMKELFRINVSEFIRKNNMVPWKISEIMPDYFLVENADLKKFGYFDKWDRSKGYIWIPEMRRRLDKIWNKRSDFKSFLIESHKECNIHLQTQ